MPGTLGDLRPEGWVDVRPVLRRAPQCDVTLHREVDDGREFVLAGSTPVGSATATLTPASPRSWAFLVGEGLLYCPAC